MSLHLLATATASVKRAPISAGKRGTPVTVLEDLQCTSLYAADPGTANALLQRLKLDTPYRMLETFVLGLQDILAGDTLVVNSKEYTVRAAAPWELPGASRQFMHLTVEEIPA